MLLISSSLLLWAFFPPGIAAAAPRGHRPVYFPPISHLDSQRPDELLTRAFREAVALRVPSGADWRLGQPDPAVCRGGCLVVSISGRRSPSPRYELQLRSFPKGAQVASAHISSPPNTALTLLADALLLKASFLLRVDVTRRGGSPSPALVAHRSTTAPSPPPPNKADGRMRRLELSLSGIALVGMTDPMLCGGVGLSAVLRLWGRLGLKAGIAYLGAGKGEDSLSTFNLVTASFQAGFTWTWRWFQLGLYAGGTLLVFWVELDDTRLEIPPSTGFTGMSGGPSMELRMALRVHRRVSLGITTRAIYSPVDLGTAVSDSRQTARFRVPRVSMQSSMDVTFRF